MSVPSPFQDTSAVCAKCKKPLESDVVTCPECSKTFHPHCIQDKTCPCCGFRGYFPRSKKLFPGKKFYAPHHIMEADFK